jgi:hypothetical protein
VTAIVVMSIMLTIGLAAIAFVDTETRSSHRERIAEARLNLTEGALAAEIFQLSRRWPYTLSLAYPASCTEASTELLCPNPAQLRAQFDAVDFALAPGWDVRVRDNVTGDSQYYEDASVLQRPRWDANADGEMWIRAQGNLDGKPRIVVARVRVEKRPVIHPPPGGPFVAGSFRSGNNGGNVLVATAPNANGVVRCSNVNSSSCVDYKPNQLSPVNSVKSDPSAGPNLAPETVESLRQIAQAAGTYYASGCPLDPSGDVVFVESGNCSYTNSSPNPVNGTSKRGIFVVASGTLSISGNITWWGAVYALNLQNCGSVNSASCINASNGDKDVVVQISGTVALRGGVYIDGAGRLAVGSSGNAGNGGIPNLTYDPSVVSDVTAFGNAGIIQNTWRELMTG